MKITTEPTRIEVWRNATRKKKGHYAWVSGVYVIVDGQKHYPPMRIREAKRYIAELKGN